MCHIGSLHCFAGIIMIATNHHVKYVLVLIPIERSSFTAFLLAKQSGIVFKNQDFELMTNKQAHFRR